MSAIWLDGSRSRGSHDELSDVDLAVAVEDAVVDTFLLELPALIESELDPVHMFVRTAAARGDPRLGEARPVDTHEV